MVFVCLFNAPNRTGGTLSSKYILFSSVQWFCVLPMLFNTINKVTDLGSVQYAIFLPFPLRETLSTSCYSGFFLASPDLEDVVSGL